MKTKTLKLWMLIRHLMDAWRLPALVTVALLLLAGNAHAQATVLAFGGGSPLPPYYGYVDGNTLTTAKFHTPAGLALDSSGQDLLVADRDNSRIRVVDLVSGQTETLIVTYTNLINKPIAVAVDDYDDVYVLNTNGSIYTFDCNLYSPTYGDVITNALNLTQVTGMALDANYNIYVTVQGNKLIRIAAFTNTQTTVATISYAGTSLQGITVKHNGLIAACDAGRNGIYLINPVTGLISTNAGFHGIGDFVTNSNPTIASSNLAKFNQPMCVAEAGNGSLIVSDYGNNRVKVVLTNGAVANLYGVTSQYWSGSYPGWANGTVESPDSTPNNVQARQPYGVVMASDGTIYTTEDYYHLVRKVTGSGLPAPLPSYPQFFNNPEGMAFDPSGKLLYIADYPNNAVDLLNLNNNQTSTYLTSTNGVSHPASVLVDTNDNLYVLNQNAGTNGSILEFDPYLNLLGTNVTGLNRPTAFTMDGNGNIYVAEQGGGIEVVFPSGTTNMIATITNANVSLQGIALFDDGAIAVSDAGNQVIWTVNPVTKAVTKLTGQLGVSGSTLGTSNLAKLFQPHQLARAGNNQLVIADYGNNRLVVATRAGTITNVLSSTNSQVWFGNPSDPTAGSTVPMFLPAGVAVNSAGLVYDSEPTNALIRGLTAAIAIPPTPPVVTLPFFESPQGIAYDSIGNYLFIADQVNNAVQVLDLTANVTSTFANTNDGVLNPVSVLVDTNENVYVLNQGTPGNGFIQEFDINGNYYGPIITGLNQPTAFTLDGYGTFFVTEQAGNIRAFGASVSNIIATVTNANVSLQGIALFDDGSIAVSDAGNQVIWSVNPITKLITKLTGQLNIHGLAIGASNFASLYQPHQLARVGGNQIVAADYGNNRLVLIQRNGTVITNNSTYHLNSSVASIWFGQNGDPVTSGSAKFVPMISPSGVAAGASGEIFTSETFYQDIRGLTGTGLAAATFNPGVPLPYYAGPAGIALNNEGTVLFVADPVNNTVSALNLVNNQTTLFLNATNGIYQPVDVAVDTSDNLYVLNEGTGGNGSIVKFDQYGNSLGTNAASLSMPTAMKMTFTGDIYVSELTGAVQKFNASGSNTLVTINTNANVQLSGIALLDNGSVVVSDAGNQVVWKIAPGATNAVLFTGVIGSSGANFGAVGSAKLNGPMRLAQASGGLLLIADSGNNRVVVANDLGTVSSALNSTNATVWFGLPIDPVANTSPNFVNMRLPVGLAIGTAGTVYASEATYKDIRGLLSTGIQAPTPPPPTPLNLVATAAYGQITLTWSASTGATNYNVKRSTSTNATYTLIGNTSLTSFVDTNVLGGSTYYYVVSAVNAGGESPNSAVASVQAPLPPVPDPQIGYADFPPGFIGSVFHPVGSIVFNNDASIVILSAAGSQSYYTYGPTSGTIPDPTTNSASAPVGYQDGDSTGQVAIYSINPQLPDVTIKAFGAKSDGSPSSAIVQSRFQFVTANPTITGDNAAQFTISDVTANAHLYYTIDGSDPSSTNGIDLGTVPTPTNVWTVGFPILTNTLFKVIATRPNYQDSAIVSTSFSSSNFVANIISFGFAYNEASSTFVASPGQTFYAPVTLTTLPNTVIYSLQFNLVVTNAGLNPGPAVAPGAFDFQTMLMKPDLQNKGLYLPIPTYAFESYGFDYSLPPPISNSIPYQGDWYQNLENTNVSENLLTVGWLERAGETNLYITTSQDLIKYSIAHDDLFPNAQYPNNVILGGYAFQVPGNATNGQTYQIQIGRPSATSDGIGAPGSAVFIAAPTNGSTSGGAPINALKFVTVGQLKYLAGSVYPFSWFNAGDFGSSNIVNADVEQVFQSAVYGLNTPPAGSDFFDAMDSCGGTYVDLGHGYLEFNSYISGPAAINPLWDGNDTSINQIAFGDGVLDVCDVYVTFRRSLDPGLNWFQRFWNSGQRVAQIVPNVAPNLLTTPLATVQSKAQPALAATVSPQVNFSAADVQGTAGQTIQVPINATILGSYPLRVLMLNLTVVPLDGSPDLTASVQFTQNAAVLGAPMTTYSDGNDNFSAVWLNSTNAGLTGSVTIGTLTFTIPSGASSNAAYAVHFDHASASPNGLASFPKQTLTGLVTLSSRTNSSFGDGIPDSWRLRWFGSIYNYLSVSNACPSGDGVNNWKKFVAGVDPNTANDFPSLNPKGSVPTGATTAIHWPSVSGVQYVVQRSSSLFPGNWTAIATNTGTGGDMEYDDTNTGKVKFYRVLILP